MKRLFLLRHAKADVGSTDRNRPLSARGKREADNLGQYLKKLALVPDLILCSSAVRTRETLDQLQKASQKQYPVVFRDDLYMASAGHLLNQIKSLDQNLQAPMIIAHNPGIFLLLQELMSKPSVENYISKFPTCALGILDFDIDHWANIKSNTGQLIDMIVPSNI